MNNLEKLVDNTFVINLKHRIDRWENVQKQLKNINYDNYTRFDAYSIYSNNIPKEYIKDINDFQMSGWYGNKFSHYGVISLAKQLGLKSVMVFEDDVIFSNNFIEIINKAIPQLNKIKWDWLQFGGNHTAFGGVNIKSSPIDDMEYLYIKDGLEKISENISRIKKMLTAHAYIVKENIYAFILKYAIKSKLSIDGFYAYEVHPRFNCYCITPCIVGQYPNMNDIGGIYADYRKCIK